VRRSSRISEVKGRIGGRAGLTYESKFNRVPGLGTVTAFLQTLKFFTIPEKCEGETLNPTLNPENLKAQNPKCEGETPRGNAI
jgi:hypothetical protein